MAHQTLDDTRFRHLTETFHETWHRSEWFTVQSTAQTYNISQLNRPSELRDLYGDSLAALS